MISLHTQPKAKFDKVYRTAQQLPVLTGGSEATGTYAGGQVAADVLHADLNKYMALTFSLCKIVATNPNYDVRTVALEHTSSEFRGLALFHATDSISRIIWADRFEKNATSLAIQLQCIDWFFSLTWIFVVNFFKLTCNNSNRPV
jgi:hypothetical protein